MNKRFFCLTNAKMALIRALLIALPGFAVAGEVPSAQGDDSAPARTYQAFAEESYPYTLEKEKVVSTFIQALRKRDPLAKEDYQAAQDKFIEDYLDSSTKYLSTRLIQQKLDQPQEKRREFGWLLTEYVPPADYVIEGAASI